MRLIPKTEEAEFPYCKAMETLLFKDPDISFEPVDFAKLIENGKRMGWTEEMLTNHVQMNKRGKCFNFCSNLPNGLQGTIWEDNIHFLFKDKNHEMRCTPIIESLSIELDVRIFR